MRRSIVVYVLTRRLRAGFRKLDPSRIPQDKLSPAASLTGAGRWGEEVALEDLPQLDLIVTGSVAVTRAGRRCGKGQGYADLGYAILRELGHAPVPVATTVHALQVLKTFPPDAHDLRVSLIVTPDEVIAVESPPPPPEHIDWARLAPQALQEMPILQALRALQAGKR